MFKATYNGQYIRLSAGAASKFRGTAVEQPTGNNQDTTKELQIRLDTQSLHILCLNELT